MFFLQAAQTPVVVQVGNRKFTLPKFRLRDITEWGQEIMEADLERITADMNEIQRRDYMTMYPPVPPTLENMKRLLRTAEGVERVIRICFGRANDGSVTQKEIDEILEVNGTGPLAGLAWQLADVDENTIMRKPPAEREDNEDPLTPSAKRESTPSRETGSPTSDSSVQSTESIPSK